MSFGYLGGAWREPLTEPRLGSVADSWNFRTQEQHFFVQARGCARLFLWDALALLIRGYARPVGSTGQLDLEAAAAEARAHYLENGDLAVEGLEGSFTLALLDGQAR